MDKNKKTDDNKLTTLSCKKSLKKRMRQFEIHKRETDADILERVIKIAEEKKSEKHKK